MISYPKLKRAAVLTPCDLTRAGLRVLLAEIGVEIVAAATPEALRPLLRQRPDVDLLITDTNQLTAAAEIAADRKIPLLVIAPTLSRALSIASNQQFRGVVTLPLAQSTLADALDSVMAGERYIALNLVPPLPGARLSMRDRELMSLDLQDIPSEQIAQWMEVKLYTLYTYRNRIRKKLLGLAPDEHPAWVRDWLRRFPGVPPRPDEGEGGRV